ncbi:RDD family protein [Frigoribacterium sp. 2-23]|uniref:RDD family protein n=1 Tax=Frigoribacterium sp. 2-23 TaxID=3415006 RepID=UPI003C6F5969
MSARRSRPVAPVRLRADQVESFEADDDELVTGEAVSLELRPTSIVLRAAGALIDYAIYVVLLIVAIILIGEANRIGLLDDSLSQAFVVGALAFCFIVLPAVVETAMRGRSVGRLAVGARIVRTDGGAIGFRHALTRSLVGLFEFVFTLGGTAVVVGLLNKSSRRLGDLLAGTYSRHERVSARPRPVFDVPWPLTGWASVADVGRLPDPLARRVASFLAQAPRMSPASRARVGYELAVETSPYVSPVPDVDPETFLMAVSALRRHREGAALQREAALLARLEPALTAVPSGFPVR